MKQTFYSNGKLLLTGEYLVLDGACALALPTKFGQYLTVSPGQKNQINWISYDHDGTIWYEDKFTFDEIRTGAKNSASSVRSTLIEILYAAYEVNKDFLNSENGYDIESRLTFPRFWGLGSSSTLINNIAEWLKIDAYQLLWNSFGGSGYDIACAKHNSPIIYQRKGDIPIVSEILFQPEFSQNIWFVYLNRKQSSKAAIVSYYANRIENLDQKLESIDRITSLVSQTDDIEVFARAHEDHERIISAMIEMETVKETFFRDFEGTIKSLGGWGGDFILAISETDPTSYFSARGFSTVIPYREMIL